MSFRYSPSSAVSASGANGPVLGMRTAAGMAQPLLAVLAPAVRGARSDGPASVSWLSVSDDRVRVVGLTTPEANSILVRLQSFSEDSPDVLVNTLWPLQGSLP